MAHGHYDQPVVDALRRLAAERDTTPARLAIAWALAKSPRIVPVIGARTRAQLDEALGALELSLAPEEVARLEAAVPPSAVAGTRYDERQMRNLDSER
jgi:aryl-alcohol dehydrogenase-like predicted oxidoreductase